MHVLLEKPSPSSTSLHLMLLSSSTNTNITLKQSIFYTIRQTLNLTTLTMPKLVLVLSLLSLCFLASEARHLSDVNPGRILHDSDKVGEKVISFEGTLIPAKTTESPPEKKTHEGILEGSGLVNKTSDGASSHKPKEDLGVVSREMEKSNGGLSGLLRIQSLATVSWHLPREKHDEQPGFHLDYSPPRIHPPSHN